MAVETQRLQFVEVPPTQSGRKQAVNHLNVRGNRISIGKLAYQELGEPDSVKVELDLENQAIRLTAGGPYATTPKSRMMQSGGFATLEDGQYDPAGGGVYLFAGGRER